MIIVNQSSNVTGKIQPITEIGKIAKQKKIPFLVDAAQSGGLVDIDVVRDNISLLAFTGHKGLYGPHGIGGLYFADGINPEPLLVGGTGTSSESIIHPDVLPDRYEAGTPNLLGIAGLVAGVKFVLDKTPEKILFHETKLKEMLINKIQKLSGIKITGHSSELKETAVLSILFNNWSSIEAAEILEQSFDIIVRPGLHCAPLMHKYLNTIKKGTVRFSFGYFNSEDEIIKAAEAIEVISKAKPII
jgi:selenocysteine lyase/cysteine desulfurase